MVGKEDYIACKVFATEFSFLPRLRRATLYHVRDTDIQYLEKDRLYETHYQLREET